MGRQQLEKYNPAIGMYEQGLSIQDIANYFDISRQAMHDVLKRRGVKFRSNLRFGEANHFHRGGMKMNKRSQHLVESAIKKGILTPNSCEKCGKTGKAKDGRNLVHARHDDYSKPLDVRWLCQSCHYDHHKLEGSQCG